MKIRSARSVAIGSFIDGLGRIGHPRRKYSTPVAKNLRLEKSGERIGMRVCIAADAPPACYRRPGNQSFYRFTTTGNRINKELIRKVSGDGQAVIEELRKERGRSLIRLILHVTKAEELASPPEWNHSAPVPVAAYSLGESSHLNPLREVGEWKIFCDEDGLIGSTTNTLLAGKVLAWRLSGEMPFACAIVGAEKFFTYSRGAAFPEGCLAGCEIDAMWLAQNGQEGLTQERDATVGRLAEFVRNL